MPSKILYLLFCLSQSLTKKIRSCRRKYYNYYSAYRDLNRIKKNAAPFLIITSLLKPYVLVLLVLVLLFLVSALVPVLALVLALAPALVLVLALVLVSVLFPVLFLVLIPLGLARLR